MAQQLPPVEKIRKVLESASRIAVVGLSPKPHRPSHRVAVYLIEAGYTVIPVNPGHETILGRPCYPDLLSVPGPLDLVDIFRRPEHVLPVVEAAIEKQAKGIWMQEGIVNVAAAELADENGLTVIMDRCIMIDHQDYLG